MKGEPFVYQLTQEQWAYCLENLDIPEKMKFLKRPPKVFTARGVLATFSVLNSPRVSALSTYVLSNMNHVDDVFKLMIEGSSKIDLSKSTLDYKTYLMLDSNTGLVKIGRSKDPKLRERTLQSEKPTIEMFAVCDRDVESELHSKLKSKRVRGEWFKLPMAEIKKIVSSYRFSTLDK